MPVPRIRVVPTGSGARAVQVIRYYRDNRPVLDHIGSAHTVEDFGWTQWSAAGTGDHGLRGLFPHGIKDLKSPSSPWVSPTTHSSRHRQNQGDALEHG